MQSLPVPRRPRSDHIGLLPNDHSHAEKKKLSDLDGRRRCNARQNLSDFFHCVGPSYGSWGIMPRDAAAIKGRANIAKAQVQRVTLEVLNNKSVPCHAQPFPRKTDNLIRLKVMKKERAANSVKAVIAERKRQRVSADGWMRIAKVRR